MNWPYYSEDEIELALSRLINLNPFIETEREDWFELADWLKGQLDLIGDIERHRLHYAINFVGEGQTFSRHKDYYEQERDKIIQPSRRSPNKIDCPQRGGSGSRSFEFCAIST